MAAVIPPWNRMQPTKNDHPSPYTVIERIDTRVEKLENSTNVLNVSVGKICVKIDAIQDRLDRSVNWRDVLLFAGIIASAVIGVVL